jgi:hypothetical protein
MSQNEIETLIAQLKDFRSRSGAIRELVAAGSEAVGPLLDALRTETQEGARWAILRCLGELKAREAVPAIVPLLEDAACRAAAQEALVRIAGQDLGARPQAWLDWAARVGGAGAVAPEMHMVGLSEERLIGLAIKGCAGAELRHKGSGLYTVQLQFKGGEKQEVSVNFNLKDHEGSPIVIVHTDCGRATPEHCEYALRRNFRMPYGALAIHDTDEGARFVMFNTLLLESLSPLELRKSALAIGQRAAHVKRELKG